MLLSILRVNTELRRLRRGLAMERNASISAELEQASGEEFDQMFLERMSAHHTGAAQMANMELAGGAFPDAQALAEQIKTTQLEEISEMQTLMGTTGATSG